MRSDHGLQLLRAGLGRVVPFPRDLGTDGMTSFEPCRDRRTGSSLLAVLIDEAGQLQLPGVILSVEDPNPSRHFYGRTGFEVDGRNDSSETMLLPLR